MRQVVLIEGKAPRFVEGIAIYLAPERICGGLVAGEMAGHLSSGAFERAVLSRTLGGRSAQNIAARPCEELTRAAARRL